MRLPDRNPRGSTSWHNTRNFTGYPVRQNQGFHINRPVEHQPQHEAVFQHGSLYLSGSNHSPVPWSEYQVLENSEIVFPIRFGCREHLSAFLMSFALENTYLLHRIREGLYYHHLVVTNGGVFRQNGSSLVPLTRNTNDTRPQRLHRVRHVGDNRFHTTQDPVDPRDL